jgi:hypothetical protein
MEGNPAKEKDEDFLYDSCRPMYSFPRVHLHDGRMRFPIRAHVPNHSRIVTKYYVVTIHSTRIEYEIKIIKQKPTRNVPTL